MATAEMYITVRPNKAWAEFSKSRLTREKQYHEAFVNSGGIPDDPDALLVARGQLVHINRALEAAK